MRKDEEGDGEVGDGCGVVWCGVVQLVWCTAVRRDVVWCGEVR